MNIHKHMHRFMCLVLHVVAVGGRGLFHSQRGSAMVWFDWASSPLQSGTVPFAKFVPSENVC